jgi:hypothetical protein
VQRVRWRVAFSAASKATGALSAVAKVIIRILRDRVFMVIPLIGEWFVAGDALPLRVSAIHADDDLTQE